MDVGLTEVQLQMTDSGGGTLHSRSLIALNVVAIVINLYDRLSKQECVCLYFLVDDHREATYVCEVASNKRTPAKREELLD